MNCRKRKFFQTKAGAEAFKKMLGCGFFYSSTQASMRFDFFNEAIAAGKDAKFVASHPYCVAWQTSQES